MRLLIAGDQDEDFILTVLEGLFEDYHITAIYAVAIQGCMDCIIPWAEDNDIPVNLYLPNSLDIPGISDAYLQIIKTEKPQVALMYDNDPRLEKCIMDQAYNENSSLEYIIKRLSE